MYDQLQSTINQQQIAFLDLRFTDTKGKEQHITLPSHQLTPTLLAQGKAFDGSSIAGWKESTNLTC